LLPLVGGGALIQALPLEPWPRLAWATLAGALCLAGVGVVLKPWRSSP
jgi:hypothetical protein